MFFLEEAEACGVCGAPHASCKGPDDLGGEGVGVTRGVIVRQAPMRDAAVQQAAIAEARPVATVPAEAGAPVARRRRR